MKNYIDAMADALVDVLKYSDSSVEWPDIDTLENNDDTLQAAWFYPALESEANSEIIAILQYTQMAGLYDEQMGDLVLGVALVEMKHFSAVRDIVIKLGGRLPQPLNTQTMQLGSNVGEALLLAIQGEIKTIQYYESIKARILSQSVTALTIQKVLDKLIADETLHLKLFYARLLELKLTQVTAPVREKIHQYLHL